MKSVHVVIRGRVQGVAYRAWTRRNAAALELSGWVRNRADGTVEAVFSGPEATVEEMIAACRRGPMGARVVAIDQRDAATAELPVRPGFAIAPTA
ncbi:MAG: acylphosphatase [Hyphomicrobiales bacterium]|nr:acylphosphatase [Hyphomicrobiales bacterium]